MTENVFEQELPTRDDDYEGAYRDIIALYDLAEALMATVEDDRAIYKNEQADILEPLADDVLDAADQLSEQFCEFADAQDKKESARKFKLRNPFKKIFSSVNECLEAVYGSPAEIAENITTVLMPAVEGLVKHTEKLFGKLKLIIEKARDLVKNRKEFVAMISREAHIANLYQQMAPDIGKG